MSVRRTSRSRRKADRDDRVYIHDTLNVLLPEHEARTGEKAPSLREIGARSGVGPGVFPALRSGSRPANLRHIKSSAKYFSVPITAFFGSFPDIDPAECQGIQWRLSRDVTALRDSAAQLAATLAVRGVEARAIHTRVVKLYDAHGGKPESGSEEWVRELVRSALGLGLLYVRPGHEPVEMLDPDLAQALGDACAQAIPGCPIRHVTVVKNVTRGFPLDPVAPYLVARAAHDVIARHFERYPDAFMIGTAGGLHAALVAHLIGSLSSPFPRSGGVARRYNVVPLTCEPFFRHQYQLADAAVGVWGEKGCALLGEHRVDARTIRATGWRIGAGALELTADAITLVRACYPQLDVAIYGCGDRSENGWIHAALLDNGIELDGQAASDLCLNFIDANGRPLAMRGAGKQREWLGISLSEVRDLARRPRKLALLLATGPHKGPALRAVALAGGANTLVVDQAAAEAALRELRALAEAGGR